LKHLLYILFFSFLSCTAQTEEKTLLQPSEAELHRVSYTSKYDNIERDYFVYLPKGYHTDSLKNWPVILHLHGNGARGNGKEDLIWVTKHGPLMEAWVQKRDLPFIIVVPQLQMMGMDTLKSYIANREMASIPLRQLEGVPQRIKMADIGNVDCNSKKDSIVYVRDMRPFEFTESAELPYPKTGNTRGWNLVEEDLMDILETIQNDYRANANKIYLTGISYGAFGAWYLSSTQPNKFAAIAPVSGWGHPDLMSSLVQQKMPIWCFSGCADNIILTKDFYPGLRKITTLGYADFKFTTVPNAGHDVWKKVFAGDDLYEWLLKQTRD